MKGMNKQGYEITIDDLNRIVAEDNKQRYSYSSDKKYIRANQGHSVSVDLELTNSKPPKYLYHGTSINVLESILDTGIKKMHASMYIYQKILKLH